MAPGREEPMSPTRVVPDCDTANEIDDRFAIALCGNNVLGIPAADTTRAGHRVCSAEC
jgi:hypothetical protein